jgi:hypothetical protein
VRKLTADKLSSPTANTNNKAIKPRVTTKAKPPRRALPAGEVQFQWFFMG